MNEAFLVVIYIYVRTILFEKFPELGRPRLHLGILFQTYDSCILGNLMSIIGGIVATVATGGAAAVAVLVIIIISVLLGVGTGGFALVTDYFNNKKYAGHIEKLVAALENDQKCRQQFEEELAELKTDEFRFKLDLKIGLREYRGAGSNALRRLTKKVAQPVDKFNSTSKSNSIIKKMFTQLPSKEGEKDFSNMLSKLLLSLKEGGLAVSKFGADDLAKVGGPITSVLGVLTIFSDTKKIFKEIAKESIGQHFEDFSAEISCLPSKEEELEEDSTEKDSKEKDNKEHN